MYSRKKTFTWIGFQSNKDEPTFDETRGRHFVYIAIPNNQRYLMNKNERQRNMGSSESRLSAGKIYRKNKQQKINKQIGYQCKLFVHQKKTDFLFHVQSRESRAWNEGNHTRTEKHSRGKFTYDLHITSPLPLTLLKGQTGTRRGYYGYHAAANENEQKF